MAPFGQNWEFLVLRGLLAMGSGVSILLLQRASIFAIALLFAVFAIAEGSLTFAAGQVRSAPVRDRFLLLQWRGAACVSTGVFLLIVPLIVQAGLASLLFALIFVWFFVSGTFDAATAIGIRGGGAGAGLSALAAVISTAALVSMFILILLYPDYIFPWVLRGVAAFLFAIGRFGSFKPGDRGLDR